MGGALLVPGSLAIIAATFPQNERGRAIGTWSAMTSLAVIAGPLFGGWLVQTVSWRAVFFINIPIAAATLLIVWRVRAGDDRPGEGDPQPIDWKGTVLITIALAALTFALIEAPSRPAAVLLAAMGVSTIAFMTFLVRERRCRNPIVPLAMFRSRDFTAANVLTLLLYAAISAGTFLLPFNLIQVQGYSPAQAGAAFLPFVVTMSLLSRWTGALADRIGPRLPLMAGPLVVAAGFALLAIEPAGGSYWTAFFPGILTIGIGMALAVAPLTTTVMTSIDDERRVGVASGINNTIARVAGLLAIALFGSVSIIVFTRKLDLRLEHEGPAIREAVRRQSVKLAAAEPPQDLDSGTRRRVRAEIDAAFISAFRIDMIASAALAAASAAAALAIRGNPRPRE
jgi:MFS family permease